MDFPIGAVPIQTCYVFSDGVIDVAIQEGTALADVRARVNRD